MIHRWAEREGEYVPVNPLDICQYNIFYAMFFYVWQLKLSID